MSGLWGRDEYRGWPTTRWPVSSLGVLVIAVAIGVGVFTYRNAIVWTPLQRWYWDQYLSAQLMPMKANSPNSDYRLLVKVDRHGQRRLAVDADVVPGPRQGRPTDPVHSVEPGASVGRNRPPGGPSALQQPADAADAL